MASTRKERAFSVHRREILSAAEKVFAAKGFFSTTMNEIARKAEFGTGTLYKYFKSKKDLYLNLIEEKADEINRMVKAELSRKTSPMERIQKTLAFQFEFIERNRDFFRIYISERSRFEWNIKDELGKEIHNKMLAYIKALAQVMKEGVRRGTFKTMDPMDMAHALVGLVNSFVFEWLISPHPYPLISKMDTVLEIFLKGISMNGKKETSR
jgi:TetR/AcrR family transcriptional regulator, fatty acid metabolism regulator protein